MYNNVPKHWTIISLLYVHETQLSLTF